MPTLLPLASGKGGVGKSVLAANLAFHLASGGKKVILADMDWGGSNAHTILGVLNTHPGVGHYMVEKDRTLADLVLPLDFPGLSFIPGDGLISGAANLPFIRKQKLIRELANLDADYVVIDLGAGTHYNTIDVFLSCGLGFMVTTPEPTAILNAYSFLKTALYRTLCQAVPAKSEARGHLQAYFASRRENDGSKGLDHLIEEVRTLHPTQGMKMATARKRLSPRVVINMAKDASEISHGARLRQVCERQIGLAIEYAAFIPWDDGVRTSVIDRKLLSPAHPDAPFAQAVGTLARKILDGQFTGAPPFGTFDDLEGLVPADS